MRRLLIVAVVFILTSGASQANEDRFLNAGNQILDGFIKPALTTLVTKSAMLEQNLSSFCKTPASDGLEHTKQAFQGVALAFGRVEILRFGPLIEKNRFERLYFWPDRRSRALKRVQRALTERDPTVLKAEQLREKSVALHGLGGLEFLLYGTGADTITTDSFRCQFAHAIAGTLHNTAIELNTVWTKEGGYGSLLITPSANNAAYRSSKEIGSEVHNVLKNGVEALRLLKLGSVLGENQQKAKPKRAPLWRSNLTIPLLIANLQALLDFQQMSGLLTDLSDEHAWTDNATRFEYENALKRLREIDLTISDAVRDEDLYNKLTYVQLVMGNLLATYTEDVGPALGLQAGFNALDGD